MIPCHDSVSAIESSAWLVFGWLAKARHSKTKSRGWRIRILQDAAQVGGAIQTLRVWIAMAASL